MAATGKDLDAKLDALYASRLEDFVGARTALAKSLDASGRRDEARRVKALKKPSAAAWAVNQLAFSEARLLAALLASGDRLRAKPSDMKDAMRERREALNAAARAAEAALARSGRAASADVSRRISATLEAIATYGRAPGGPVAGRLAEDVPAPGFDEIASLGLLGGAPPGVRRSVSRPPVPAKAPRTEPPKVPSKRDLARERALEEKRRRDDAKRADALRKDVQTARARLASAEKALADARRARAALETRLGHAAAEETRLAAAASEARAAAQAAASALEGARKSVTPGEAAR